MKKMKFIGYANSASVANDADRMFVYQSSEDAWLAEGTNIVKVYAEVPRRKK